MFLLTSIPTSRFVCRTDYSIQVPERGSVDPRWEAQGGLGETSADSGSLSSPRTFRVPELWRGACEVRAWLLRWSISSWL